jgi:hypothetical protein
VLIAEDSAGGMYRYYTCSTKARQGERGCRGLTVPMGKLDRAVVDHLEWRLLDPVRLTTMMDQLLERREEWNDAVAGTSPSCASAPRKRKRS